jgi:two-component system sensor histidine kinase YesM
MDCQILNVMIQPAVENAIFHGIAPKETTGKLWIIIRREEENLVVCVEDDGVGMTEETIAEQLQSEHVQKGGVRKIGIANVRNRIRETYGEPYDLQIKSKVNEGTRVIMTVPFVRQKQEGE